MKNDKASNCDNNDSNNKKKTAAPATAEIQGRKNQPKQLQMSTKVFVVVRKISLNCWKMPNAKWSSENP